MLHLQLHSMRHEVKEESFDTISSYWQDARSHLKCDCIFVLPGWLKSWWQSFGAGDDMRLLSVRDDGAAIGIAPLQLKGKKARFIGDANVCDYLDFVIAPGREADFFDAVTDYLRHQGVEHLDLAPVRYDSVVWNHLINGAKSDRGYDVIVEQEDVLVEMDLPSSWDAYLVSLSTKQRLETKRKLKKLENAGDVSYCVYAGAEEMDTFFALFGRNRRDKAAFMTPKMQLFFRLLAESMAEIGILRIGVLQLDALPVAAVMCFDYDGVVYLYNSAYDAQHAYLSVGLISKIMCIKDSIEKGRKSFNFLKGAEEYKYRLGGVEVPVYNCQVILR